MLTFTQEWRHQLRSSLHPLLFATVYKLADLFARLLHLSSPGRADFLVAAPKTAQALIATIGDFYTWKLARLVYGRGSHEATAVVGLIGSACRIYSTLIDRASWP
jgi:phosphatidylinositol glycan class B